VLTQIKVSTASRSRFYDIKRYKLYASEKFNERFRRYVEEVGDGGQVYAEEMFDELVKTLGLKELSGDDFYACATSQI
jgi:hypothetical protein